MPGLRAALEEVRRLAEDLVPGGKARLLPAGEPRPDGLAAQLTRPDGQPRGWLVVETSGPPPEGAQAALERLAGLTPRLGLRTADRHENLASLIRSMPVRACMMDGEMRLIAVSESSAEDLRISPSDLEGKRLHELLPEVFSRFPSAHARAMQGETLRTPRLEWRGPDGKTRWFRSEISPWHDADGAIAGVVTFAVEITDVVVALDAAQRAAERLSVAAGLADIHIWEADFVTSEVMTAGSGETFFDGSFSHDDMFGDPAVTIHPGDRERVYGPWAEAVLADRPFRAEHRINRQDDREVWAASTVKLVRDPAGHTVRMIGAMQNITDHKRTEADLQRAVDAAEAANRAKSAFLATMSHEIRTPLNGVLGMAQALGSDALTPVQRDRVEVIRASGEALLAILNDVLDLSKIEAGRLELDESEFNLGDLMTMSCAPFQEAARAKGLRFVLELENGLGRYRGDPNRLRQIVQNLVSNAVKFTEVGEIRATVEWCGDWLEIKVSDTGPGISVDDQQRLFAKFEQLDSSTTRRFGGTGLGLSISRELARLMGGDIKVATDQGHGATFTVSLPIVLLGEEVQVPEAAAHPTGGHGVAALRVLAAEDNPVNQRVLETLLSQLGVDLTIVETGAAAVAAFDQGGWDLILMDIHMPEMDGVAATTAIRSLEAGRGLVRTPIIALSADAMSHQVATYLASGFDGHVAKPIVVQTLIETIEAALEDAPAPVRPPAPLSASA
jgi:PAS domain S-box-containing protein